MKTILIGTSVINSFGMKKSISFEFEENWIEKETPTWPKIINREWPTLHNKD